MKPKANFAPYVRKAWLQTLPAEHRAIAATLCDLLEAAFDPADITLYSGFPIVVRNGEWTAGFAMRSKGPVAYCCSPKALAAMRAELAPLMSGKSCIAVRATKHLSLDQVLDLVGRTFCEASKHGGMIAKAEAKKRGRTPTNASSDRPKARSLVRKRPRQR
jgi:hypothetical protein